MLEEVIPGVGKRSKVVINEKVEGSDEEGQVSFENLHKVKP